MEYRNANGRVVTTNARGEVEHLEAPHGLAGNSKMVIDHGPHGERIVENGHPGARVVSYGPNRGFVERPLRPGYMSRTYVRDGHAYAHVYREYRFHDRSYYRYEHGVYYNRRFYDWAHARWDPPGRYMWYGIARPAPWFGYYHGYFVPYPTYSSGDLWLTDFVIADALRTAYENEQAANRNQSAPPPGGAAPAGFTMTPEVKAEIDNEVKEELAEEQHAAEHPDGAAPPAQAVNEEVPDALKPSQRVFVVADTMSLPDPAGGAGCGLSAGDVVMRLSDTPDANENVAVSVQTSKQGGCAVGQKGLLSVQELQEMHNHFREQLDAGLNQMSEGQAKGLPNNPPAEPHQVANGTAEPAPNAAAQIAGQEGEASNLEAQVRQ